MNKSIPNRYRCDVILAIISMCVCVERERERERAWVKRTHVNGIEYDIRCKNSTGRITEVQKTPILCDNIKHRMMIW